jgi:nicotinate-nucleotide pyrophosphorylase (carboxylating)
MPQKQGNQARTPPSPEWGAVEESACAPLVALALAEDLGERGDLTSELLLEPAAVGRAAFVVRTRGVLAGTPAVLAVYRKIDPELRVLFVAGDGTAVEAGTIAGTVEGRIRGILAGERTALNFLQHLSGIATQTQRFVNAIAGLPCVIMDTRKTLPGWRTLEKYAVRCGGGQNHRMGLYDAILIKDNHLAALSGLPDPVSHAVRTARTRTGTAVMVEVEVADLDQLDRALAAGPDRILLDNMNLESLREAVRRRDAHGSRIPLEASGGVNLTTIRAIAETGVDFISIGALTHSAPALDIALDYQ